MTQLVLPLETRSALGRADFIVTPANERAIAFLDHWTNYPERFLRKGIQHLPDELWVGDEDTERLARADFPNVPIRLVPNPLSFESILDLPIPDIEFGVFGMANLSLGATFSLAMVNNQFQIGAGLQVAKQSAPMRGKRKPRPVE